MAIMRINKTRDFTVMSNTHFKEKDMSLKAKGLLSQMLSLPDNWDYSIAGLVAINKESETAIKNTLNELKEFGYLEVTKRQSAETGYFEYVYDVYEQPQHKNPEVENPQVDNPAVDYPEVENHRQLNTNQLNTKRLKTKESNTYISEFDVLWALYPRKQGKSAALKAYEKARKKGVDFDTVKQGIESYSRYIKDNNIEQRYIKQGSTWFNGECWNDDYRKPRKQTSYNIDELMKIDTLDYLGD